MDMIFEVIGMVVSFKTLLIIFLGTGVGIMIGALPGLGPTVGTTLMIPLTYGMEPVTAIILLVAVYMAAEYGGSITAILLNTPGTTAATATLLDGYPLTKKGLPGKALGASITASTIGGIISTFILLFLALPLMKVALKFGPMEFFALGLFGISLVASLSNKSILKGILAGVLGLIIATIGIDPLTGHARYTFGSYFLLEGISLMPALVGLYALSEVLFLFDSKETEKKGTKISNQFITLKEFKDMLPVIITGSFIGAGTGIIPGAGGSIGGWLSYQQARRFAKDRDDYGNGALSGVAASESANNAVVGGALIPLLALGIPGSPTTAVLLGALMLHGVSPGPDILTNDAPLFYGIVIGLFLTCIVMFLVGNFLKNFWVKMINIPSRIIAPVVLCIAVVGAFSVRSLMFDVFIAVGFGFLGYFMRKFEYPLAPTVLALVLGKMMESNLRRSLLISNGDWGIFLTKPISIIFIILAFVSFFSPIIRMHMGKIKQSKKNG